MSDQASSTEPTDAPANQQQQQDQQVQQEQTDPFLLIETGNALSSTGHHWSACSKYLSASDRLQALANEARSDAKAKRNAKSSDGNTSSSEGRDSRVRIKKAVELERIAALYGRESDSYYNQARNSLLDAMRVEGEQDSAQIKEREGGKELSGAGETKRIQEMLSDEEVIKRRRLFDRLFGRPELKVEESAPTLDNSVQNHPTKPSAEVSSIAAEQEDAEPPAQEESEALSAREKRKDDNDDVDTSRIDKGKETDLDIPSAPTAQEDDVVVSSLQSRLASFESSLPSTLKSDAERVTDLNSKLRGLGYHLPTSPDIKRHLTGKNIHTAQPMSDEEQIRQIVDMARDEARLEGAAVDDAAAEAAIGAVTGTGAASSSNVGGEESNDMKINKEDDLAAILQKAHLDVGLEKMDHKSSIAEMFSSLQQVKADAAALGAMNTTDEGRLLTLLADAQEHLFTASAYFEDEEEAAEELADGEIGVEYDEDGVVLPLEETKPVALTKGMEQGRLSLIEAKKCVDDMLRILNP